MPDERNFEVKHRRGSNLGTRPSDKSLQVDPSTVLHMQASCGACLFWCLFVCRKCSSQHIMCLPVQSMACTRANIPCLFHSAKTNEPVRICEAFWKLPARSHTHASTYKTQTCLVLRTYCSCAFSTHTCKSKLTFLGF